MAHVYAVHNRKGGTGKTSLVFHLAGAYAREGRRVLLVDVDPQASLSQAFFGPDGAWAFDYPRTVASLFDEAAGTDPAGLVHETHLDNIFLAPAGARLGDWNYPRPRECGELQDVLRLFVNEVRAAFDVVLLDCPPCLQLAAWAAVVAADFVVAPVIPEPPGLEGLAHVQKFVDTAVAGRNPALRLAALVLSLVQPRLGLHQSHEHLLRQMEPDLVAQARLPYAAPFKEALVARCPLPLLKPKVAGAKAVIALAAELDGKARDAAAAPPRYYYGPNRFEVDAGEGERRPPCPIPHAA